MTCWLCGFETTELATNAKAATCKNGPCQVCIAVADVDEEINQAVASLQRLIAKRCDLRSEQNRIHGNILHRLPVELRNHIIELVRPTRSEILPTIGKVSPYAKRSNFTSICRSWRDIAWSSPFLWSTLRMVLGKSDPSSWVNFVHDRILRSQTSPLDLDIRIIDQSKEGFELALKGMAPVLEAYHRVRNLKVSLHTFHDGGINLPAPLLDPKVSPETIEISCISLQSLQISWNHLTYAIVMGIYLEEVRQLFQHALQLTRCHVVQPLCDSAAIVSPSPIVHQRLKSLSIIGDREVAALLLGSLTFPCLQEFHTNDVFVLTPAYLPELVHRSSCPLTRITTCIDVNGYDAFHNLQPLLGVTDLVLEGIYDVITTRKLLFEGYFPDLRHITLRLNGFFSLWDCGIFSDLIDRERSRPNSPNERRLRRILVVDQFQSEFNLSIFWSSDRGIKLKALELKIILREDGFEVLLTEDAPVIYDV